MVRKFVTMTLIASGLALSACSTGCGLGRDVTSAGNTTQNAMK